MIHETPKEPRGLNESSQIWYNKVFSGQITESEFVEGQNRWIDVRDLATAHILALEVESAGGKRFICSQAKCC